MRRDIEQAGLRSHTLCPKPCPQRANSTSKHAAREGPKKAHKELIGGCPQNNKTTPGNHQGRKNSSVALRALPTNLLPYQKPAVEEHITPQLRVTQGNKREECPSQRKRKGGPKNACKQAHRECVRVKKSVFFVLAMQLCHQREGPKGRTNSRKGPKVWLIAGV